jgi:hypothetical protein
VLLACERHVRDRQALGTHRLEHLARLLGGHDLVLQALKQDQRAGQPIGMMDRRARHVQIAPLRIRADQAIEVARFELVRVLGERLEVADAEVARPGAELAPER